MILERIRLYNFRCYEQAELQPDPRFNVITGLNGQGKTSLLEAVGLLGFLKSFRNAKNSEMLRLGTTEGSIQGEVIHDDLKFQLGVKLWPTRKQATINGKSCKYLSEYVCKVAAVSFSPTDLEIVRGGPDNRRNWVDKLSQILIPTHADAVVRYGRILDQRNRQLRNLAEGKLSRLPDDFQTWTEELVFWGAQIIHNRINSVDKIVDKISSYYREISHENEGISIRYLSEILAQVHCGQVKVSSLELIDQALRKSLETTRQKELVLGTTVTGPHRDDLEINLGDRLVKAFGSQGEVRSLVLAMRLSEVEAYRQTQGVDPILLIDDFSSELDARRRSFLLEYLSRSGSQVFLSTTEELDLGKVFLVQEGRIVPHGDRHIRDER